MNELKKILMLSEDDNQGRITYNKETLMILSKNVPCQRIPPCLVGDFFGEDGCWDPELWHQSFSTSTQTKSERICKTADDIDIHSGLVLGPQRRSFQGGCHVRVSSNIGKSYSSSSKTSGSSGVKALTNAPNPNTNATKHTRQHSHQEHEQHRSYRNNGMNEEKVEWNVDQRRRGDQNDTEGIEKSKDFIRSFSHPNKKHSQRNFSYVNRDEEPEWISYGPSSKFDTIELQGFEESQDFSWMGKEIPMDDVPKRKKKSEVSPNKEDIAKAHTGDDLKLKNSFISEEHQVSSSNSDPVNKEIAVSDTEDEADMKEVKSRFSRWFEHPQTSVTESVPSPAVITISPKSLETTEVAASETDVHEADAFNRLIASLRASDKVKQQMQQRNQQIQALQSIINVSKSRKVSDFTRLSSPEGTHGDGVLKPVAQSKSLKQQLEMQKNVYQLKKRQIEQQQKSSLKIFAHDEPALLKASSSKVHESNNAITEERALATASLAAKLAEKTQKNDFLNLKLKRSSNEVGQTISAFEPSTEDKAISFISMPQPKSENIGAKNLFHQHESALLIAQMLAKAGVTEEQLKQLTLDQQELIISMVQNQFSHRDILKLVKQDSHAEYANSNHPRHLTTSQLSVTQCLASSTNSAPDISPLHVSGTHTVRKLPNVTTLTNLPIHAKESVPVSYTQQTHGSSRPQPSRVFNHTVLPVHPTLISPVVPHLVPSNITHPLISPIAHPTFTQMVQPTASAISQPHPALLMQMQQQMYASQVAQQQQQHAVLAAMHQQQLVNGQFSDKTQSEIQKDETFQNPLSQWFSREVLRQSQFSAAAPPVRDSTRVYSTPNAHPNTGPVMQNKH